MSRLKWWPWSNPGPTPEAAKEAREAERIKRESRRRAIAASVESAHHMTLSSRLRAVTTDNHFSEHLERLYRE